MTCPLTITLRQHITCKVLLSQGCKPGPASCNVNHMELPSGYMCMELCWILSKAKTNYLYYKGVFPLGKHCLFEKTVGLTLQKLLYVLFLSVKRVRTSLTVLFVDFTVKVLI